MDFLLIAIIAVIVVGGAFAGGFRLAHMQNIANNTVRLIATLIVVLILGTSALLGLRNRNIEQANRIRQAQSKPTLTIPQIETLELGEVTTYPLQAGNQLALTYQGERGQVVTLSVTPDSGPAPDVAIIIQPAGNPPITDQTVIPQGNVTTICGYELDGSDTYTFTFRAPETTDYTVTFVAGNNCREE